MFVMIGLQALKLGTLGLAVSEAVQGNLFAGLTDIQLVFPDWLGMAITLQPLTGVNLDCEARSETVQKVWRIAVGCLSAALVSSGVELYWQAVTLQLAIIAISSVAVFFGRSLPVYDKPALVKVQ